MKTILDAVNEFKGEWPYSRNINRMIYCHTSYGRDFDLGDLSSYCTDDWSGLNKLNWREFCTIEEFNEQVKECSNNFGLPSVTAKPIYTQEMCDNGELPSVGMECLIKKSHQSDTEFNEGFIIGFSKDREWLVFSDYLDNLEQHNINNGIYRFKPIDNRTPKEKAVADLMDEQASLIGNIAYMKKSFGIAYDKWVK